jgi:hypothetical protein
MQNFERSSKRTCFLVSKSQEMYTLKISDVLKPMRFTKMQNSSLLIAVNFSLLQCPLFVYGDNKTLSFHFKKT